MSERDLIHALRGLIEQHAPSDHQAQLMVQEIVRRDTWRLRILGGLSILFGVAGIAALFAVLFNLKWYLIISSGTVERLANNAEVSRQIFHFERAVHHSLEICLWCLVAWGIGSVCTIWLIASSRRATLSQINLSLMRLSEQVKELRHVSSRAAPPSQTGAGP